MVIHDWYEVSDAMTLLAIGLFLALSVGASYVFPQARETTSDGGQAEGPGPGQSA